MNISLRLLVPLPAGPLAATRLAVPFAVLSTVGPTGLVPSPVQPVTPVPMAVGRLPFLVAGLVMRPRRPVPAVETPL